MIKRYNKITVLFYSLVSQLNGWSVDSQFQIYVTPSFTSLNEKKLDFIIYFKPIIIVDYKIKVLIFKVKNYLAWNDNTQSLWFWTVFHKTLLSTSRINTSCLSVILNCSFSQLIFYLFNIEFLGNAFYKNIFGGSNQIFLSIKNWFITA